MPELPDVEVFRRYFDATGLKQPVKDVQVLDERILGGAEKRKLSDFLVGHRFTGTQRRGKYLLAETDDGRGVAFHFGMTGYFDYHDESSEVAYERVGFDYENGGHLSYVNRRRLGRVTPVDDAEGFWEHEHLGPDALALSDREFVEVLCRKKSSVKSALMDQELIAGIGNIYGDEILFHARIHPKRSVPSLSDKDLHKLYRSMHKVLDMAIERQADPERFPRTWLIHSRSSGSRCPRCDGPVSKVTVAGRSGYACERCQT